MKLRRVAVTGMGIVSSLGNEVDTVWQALLSGRSGISRIEHFDASAYTTQISGSIPHFDAETYIPAKDLKKMDLFIQYGIAAGIQAVEDAGILEATALDRIGVAIGSGIGGLQTIENNHIRLLEGGPKKISPFFIPASIINMISGHLAVRYGFMGPNFAISTACATGTHNIGCAARSIACGDADVMLAGGAEMASTPTSLAGFGAARALSRRNDDPQRANRPWDKDRDGFVLSDGAGVLLLEEYEHASARGAKIYAELTGFGMSCDGYHITAPLASGQGGAMAMRRAMADAEINADDVQYINAHGTSTTIGDKAEATAIADVFQNHQAHLAVSSTKSMTGHLVGAAGAVEAIFTILALCHQTIPATMNLDEIDDGLPPLDYVANKARSTQLVNAMSNSFGFGGTNVSLIFQKV